MMHPEMEKFNRLVVDARSGNGYHPHPEPKDEDWTEPTEQDNADAKETQVFDALTDLVREALGDDNAARLAMGEAGAKIKEIFGFGGLQDVANETHVVYKTLAERADVVEFYEGVSAGQKVTLYESTARELLAENPTLQWTHLRDARRLGDLGKAKAGLQKAIKEGYTPTQFQKYIQDILGKPSKKKLCGGCAHWTTNPHQAEGWGECVIAKNDGDYPANKLSLALAFADNDRGAHLFTHKDFSCNQWQRGS